jgi:hypothetical protein
LARDSRGPRLSAEDLLLAARFLTRLPGFLRRPLTDEMAQAILRRRLEQRESAVLALVAASVYGNPVHPAHTLLRAVGCEYGDLEKLVRREGVEPALRALALRGVYFTSDEFKGRRTIKRGSVALDVTPAMFRNPIAQAYVPSQSSGSRGPGTTSDVDFDFVRDLAVNHRLVMQARGGLVWTHAFWHVPGTVTLKRALWQAVAGFAPVHWFSPVDPAAAGLHPRYRWSARGMRWVSLLSGVPLPAPTYAPPEDPAPLLRWMRAVIAGGGVPHIGTYSGAAVRLVEAALAAGVDMRGTQLTISGEPTTGARLAAVQRTGATAVPQYGSSDAGSAIAYGCLAPAAPDDMHLFHDTQALIQPGDDFPLEAGLSPRGLLVTSMLSNAPLALLNVSLGDRAVLESRACGCPFERIGWATHLHTVRSDEKLTIGGMNLPDVDLVGLLEDVLPARFGGGPTHYQLIDEEGDDGHRRLRLAVHPAVGPLDTRAVADAFLTAIGQSSAVARLTELLWREAGVLSVDRRVPESGNSGKILHVHVGPQGGA